MTKKAKGGDEAAKVHAAVAEKLIALLGDDKPARAGDWSEAELESVRDAQLITAKPVLYVCNVDEAGLGQENAQVAAVRAKAEEEGAGVVVICGQVEAEIAELEDEAEREAFLEDLGLTESGIARLSRETYSLLGMQTYFTAGPT